MKTTKTIAAVLMALMAIIFTAAKPGSLEFADKDFDFGTISDKHAPVVHEYAFTNVSSQPVAILSVSTGCGCTKPSYPLEPVKPGKKAKIKITFLPAGQRGEINKDIRVRYRGATAPRSERVTLRLHGTVVPDKK